MIYLEIRGGLASHPYNRSVIVVINEHEASEHSNKQV